jgi:hypothetical protein
MALRDADAVAADMMTWSSNADLSAVRNKGLRLLRRPTYRERYSVRLPERTIGETVE